MLVAVKHVVDSGMNIPNSRKEWESIGYNVQGIVMQKTELALLQKFTEHVKNNHTHLSTINYIVSFADNNRDGYISTLNDRSSNRLVDMASKDVSAMNVENGMLTPSQANKVRALVGNNDKNFFSVNIIDLQGALTRAIIEDKQTIEGIYKRITGEEPVLNTTYGIEEARVKFRNALEIHLSLIRAATGNSNAGLDALLQGKQTAYISNIKERLAKGETITIQPVGNVGFNNGMKNIASGIFGVGVAVLSGGAIVLNAYNGREVKAENFISVDNDSAFLQKSKGILGGLANFVLGRNLKLAIGQDDFLNAFQNRIKHQAETIMKLTPNTDPKTISDPDIRKAFEMAIQHKYIQNAEDMKIFQKAVIENIIDFEARGVSDYKAIWASINPMFLGMHYDRVNTKKVATKVSDANLAEGRITEREKNIETMTGVKVSADFKTFNINQTLVDYTGAYQGEIPVLIKNEKGELAPIPATITHNSPKQLHLTITTNQGKVFYVATFSDRPAQSSTSAVAVEKPKQVEGEIKMTAEATRLVNSRTEFLEKTRSNMGESIYVMTRNSRYVNFNKALALIGDQKYSEALQTLKQGKTNTEKTLYTQFKNNPEGLVTALTFKYGSKTRNHQGEAGPRVYTGAHSNKVMNAENNLTNHNKTTSEVEKEFRSHTLHKPSELSDLVSGQALAVSVYATPKGGTHRIDKMSGSITVSDKIIDITNKEAKSEIFDRHVVDNQKNLEALNAFLKSAGKTEITMDAYKAWIVESVLPTGITQDMVVANARFIEARAMIQGNMCANKTEVIAYPLLKRQPNQTPPSVDQGAAVATVGSTTVLTENATNMVNSDIGVTPIAAVNEGGKTAPEATHISTTPGTEVIDIASNPGATITSSGNTA